MTGHKVRSSDWFDLLSPMSAKIETLVICDGPICGEVYAEGDARHESASQQREGYGGDGWHFSGGKDFCQKCWEARRKNRSNTEPSRAKT